MINKSLSSLGNVINSLVEMSDGRSRHIPYRDSKLTFLLKDSLGGNSKTCIIANISPSYMSYGETLSTLRFAERAKMVKNKAVINEDSVGTVSELKEEVKRLKNLLKNSQSGPSSMIAFEVNERIKIVEGLLEQNLRIRLQSENAMQQEIEERDVYIGSLTAALEKCEKKIVGDRKIMKAKDETLKKLQKNESISESKIISALREELEHLKKENENHPVAAMLTAENLKLKQQVSMLENELKESSVSLTSRLKESHDFTEKLQIALRKGANEREQLRILLEEYSKKSKSEGPSPLKELQVAKKQIQDLMDLLEKEKSKTLSLEEQLNTVSESQTLEDYDTSSRYSKQSTLNASAMLIFPDQDNQEILKKCLEENERLYKDVETKSFTIQSLHETIDSLENTNEKLVKENRMLRKNEDHTFRQEEEIDRLQDDAMRKENKIEELQNEIETIVAENEFLSTHFIDFGQQISQKEKKISELTEKLSARPNRNQIEESLKMKSELEEVKQQCSEYLTQYEGIKSEFDLSISSREQMLEELKILQSNESSIENECKELKSKLASIEQENEKLSENLSELSGEIVQVSGQNNLNQKIKLHAKMKEENNKLKEQNYQLREELRTKNKKLETAGKKLELISKGGKDFDSVSEGEREKAEEFEKQLMEVNVVIEEINSTVFSLPFIDELKGGKLQEKVADAFEFFSQDLQLKQGKIEDLESEIMKKSLSLKILENESLLLRQKIQQYV